MQTPRFFKPDHEWDWNSLAQSRTRDSALSKQEAVLLPSCQLESVCQSQLWSHLPKRYEEEVFDLVLHLSAEILTVLWMCDMSLLTLLMTAVSLWVQVGKLKQGTDAIT